MKGTNKINVSMDSITNKYRGTYCQSLFDPIQTHAIYGISTTDKPEIQASLKQMGAKKFRTVKANCKGLVILCFDASAIKN